MDNDVLHGHGRHSEGAFARLPLAVGKLAVVAVTASAHTPHSDTSDEDAGEEKAHKQVRGEVVPLSGACS